LIAQAQCLEGGMFGPVQRRRQLVFGLQIVVRKNV
jgi:hypothetical protein